MLDPKAPSQAPCLCEYRVCHNALSSYASCSRPRNQQIASEYQRDVIDISAEYYPLERATAVSNQVAVISAFVVVEYRLSHPENHLFLFYI